MRPEWEPQAAVVLQLRIQMQICVAATRTKFQNRHILISYLHFAMQQFTRYYFLLLMMCNPCMKQEKKAMQRICSISPSPGTQSSPSAVPAVPRSRAAGRAATQSSATTVSSCGTLIRHAMQRASREPRASVWGRSGHRPSATAKRAALQVSELQIHCPVFCLTIESLQDHDSKMICLILSSVVLSSFGTDVACFLWH